MAYLIGVDIGTSGTKTVIFDEAWKTIAQATIEYPISPIGRKQVVFFPGKVSGTRKLRAGETEAFKWVSAAELGDHLFPDTLAACQTIL